MKNTESYYMYALLQHIFASLEFCDEMKYILNFSSPKNDYNGNDDDDDGGDMDDGYNHDNGEKEEMITRKVMIVIIIIILIKIKIIIIIMII